MSSVKTKLDELEQQAARLPTVSAAANNFRVDRLTDEELLGYERITQRCRRGDRYDLSILSVPELRELKHTRILSSPLLSDAEVARARELKDGPDPNGEYDVLAKRVGFGGGSNSQAL